MRQTDRRKESIHQTQGFQKMLLERQTFLVKEQVAMFKLTDHYDIFDPESGEQI